MRSASSRSRRARSSATPTTRCSSPSAAARASRCRACSTPSSTSASTTSPWRALPLRRRTSASRGTPTADSCRCTRTSSRASRARRSRTRSRRPRAIAGSRTTPSSTPTRCASSSTRSRACTRARPARTSRRTRRSSSRERSAPSSTPGTASARALSYRRINRIPDEWGTAVNVQQMVFGNKGEDSGSGVAFSRDEVTGEPEPSGDFLVNAQGEDVVSGVRNTLDIKELADVMPEAYEELMDILRTLERHYKDMQDTEFTVEEGQLYMLQTRNAKRPAQAAVRFAVDAVNEELLTREEALLTIDAETLEALLHPMFDPNAEFEVLATGVAASPGAAVGEIVFRAGEAVQAARDGRDVILVRPFTEADDVAGFRAAKGVLTSEGGKASHAALVARGMGVPAVTGAGLEIDLDAGEVRMGETTLKAGDRIAMDGTTGRITTDDVPLVEPEVSDEFDTVLEWADDVKSLEV